MRLSKLLSPFLLLAFLPLTAQVERNLRTVTDLSDAYQQIPSKSEVAAIYDFTPVSRAVFEPYKYLTYQARTAWIGTAPSGQIPSGTDTKIQAVFNPFTAGVAVAGNGNNPGKSYAAGIVFGLRIPTVGGPQVRMYWWPQGNSKSPATAIQDPSTSSDIVGIPLYADPAGNVTPIITPGLTLAQVIAVTTHVRFTITGSHGARTVDLPCPWKIWDSPTAAALAAKSLAYDSGFSPQTNAFTSSSGSAPFDPWSQNLNTASTTSGPFAINVSGTTSILGPDTTYPNSDTALLSTNWVSGIINAAKNINDFRIGQFYYTPDFLTWVFGGTQVRYVDPTNGQTSWVDAGSTLLNTTAYHSTTYKNGYAVPDTFNDGIAGWANGLPNMTRYQAIKYASINVMLSKMGTLQFAYRFLDPTYPTSSNTADTGNHEETQTSSFSSFGGSTTANYTSQGMRTLRMMSLANLLAQTEPLQAWGPRSWDWDLSNYTNFATYDVGSPDPFTPEALNYALANTYRQIADNQPGYKRDAQNSGCANTYVIVFPGQGFDDSYSAALKGDAANIPGNGNNAAGGNANGAYGTGNNAASLSPTDASFSSPILSSIAAFGTGPKRATAWGAPWTLSINGNTRRIQTVVISVGVPGAYRFKNTNPGSRSPHEQLFRIAQWGDPGRPAWQPSNGSSKQPDLPIQLSGYVSGAATQYTKVYYFTGSDPTNLEKAFDQVAQYIVSAGAALSAPATPATGVRAANAAYFGIFKTSLGSGASINKTPLWSGNLYGMGVLQSTQFIDPTNTGLGTHDVLSFYGYDSKGNPGTDPADIATGIPNFNNAHLWDSYDLFGKYLAADLTANAAPTPNTSGQLFPSGAMLWTQRAMFTMVGGKKVRWPNVESAGTTKPTASDPDGVITALTSTVKDVNTNDGTLLSTNITADQALNFIAWVRGAQNADDLKDPNNSTSNRLDIMGDIVNSAPLAVELTLSDVDSTGAVNTDPIIPSEVDAAPSAVKIPGNPFTGSAYSDPHARLIIVGTNVGQLECFFEWSASSYSGKNDAANNPINFVDAKAIELWSFIPPDFWQALYRLYMTRNTPSKDPSEYPNLNHSYMVDGDPALYHVDLPPSSAFGNALPDGRVSFGENAVVIFGNRKGARSYYGLQISDIGKSITPATFKVAWVLNPRDPLGATQALPQVATKSLTDAAPLISSMGMSTSVPAIATVNYPGSTASPISTPPTTQDVVFLGGGYSNPEMDARYGQKMGRLVLGLDPINGSILRSWDLRSLTGAVSEGVTPLKLFSGAQSQRLYFADTLGGIWCINNDQKPTDFVLADGYRIDTSYLDDWNAVRPIYKAGGNQDSSGKNLVMRFTTRPDVFNLQGGFPSSSTDSTNPNPNPMTVIVAIGAGDRNNPTDKEETYNIGGTYTSGSWVGGVTTPQYPPKLNRFMVLADRQDSKKLSYDGNNSAGTGTGIPDSDMTSIPNDGTGWATNYSDARVVPGNPSYVLKNDDKHNGYYVDLSTGSLPSNNWSGGLSFDKVLVSPLIKQGLLFFSVYDIFNASGFNCSPNSFTRTFRQCDITRPLALNLQTTDLTVVANIQGSASKNDSNCSGLAFYFNSLSSQLVDAGNRVLQGGALTQGQSTLGSTINTETQAGQNTPSIQSVKDTDLTKGIRIRAWRIVR
ncbi:hypothetical protein [Geothrix campi]|uniref:hypothetical protein n=1 Tax=Geothrix campi TaxID=2966450 RepID=UPI002149198E|nr:hypothetical protein [Geothrix sp. SG10]